MKDVCHHWIRNLASVLGWVLKTCITTRTNEPPELNPVDASRLLAACDDFGARSWWVGLEECIYALSNFDKKFLFRVRGVSRVLLTRGTGSFPLS